MLWAKIKTAKSLHRDYLCDLELYKRNNLNYYMPSIAFMCEEVIVRYFRRYGPMRCDDYNTLLIKISRKYSGNPASTMRSIFNGYLPYKAHKIVYCNPSLYGGARLQKQFSDEQIGARRNRILDNRKKHYCMCCCNIDYNAIMRPVKQSEHEIVNAMPQKWMCDTCVSIPYVCKICGTKHENKLKEYYFDAQHLYHKCYQHIVNHGRMCAGCAKKTKKVIDAHNEMMTLKSLTNKIKRNLK